MRNEMGFNRRVSKHIWVMDNKAREINSPLIKQLIDETSPEELAKIDADMNNKQQTAVGWFIEELEYKGDLRETPSIRNIQLNIDTSDYMELKQQAKAMHKEEMIKFGCLLTQAPQHIIEEAYNETYGGNK
jgi:hypothetical protein